MYIKQFKQSKSYYVQVKIKFKSFKGTRISKAVRLKWQIGATIKSEG